jgi:AraC-like DNA-binding protein
MHVVIACEGVLRFRVGARWQRAAGIVTPPDVAHEIDASGRDVMLVFVDPESRAGAVLASALGGRVRAISEAERDAIDLRAAPEALMRLGAERWLDRSIAALGLAPPARAKRMHPRVRAALGVLARDSSASLEALAGEVGLSPSRLMHAFTESVGIPLRPYVAWLRLQRAAGEIVRGRPLTEAAATAGYADAAHMTRSFRAMLGMTPSMLRPRS